ncbi:TIGR03915 family putative DNA repair protein [uncultured Maribacter sp.]|uniref:TIGR03915 family putative DNA repair protein n=1 Tax=uncultured Maribacter sp. TaxID=431308 RepID=UPI0026118243|nr:TIGR03915 family putative DNA repair protein [uncultured Maribacter sp.]
MEETKTLIYDGSFNGFLTAIYYAFETNKSGIIIQKKGDKPSGIFSNSSIIFTDMRKAQNVWKTIQNKNNAAIKNIYFAFLSENKNIENQLYLYIKNLFNPYIASQIGYSIVIQIKLENTALRVAKEKKYLEKSIEFQLSKDQILFSNISPNNDVLPLISKYFRTRHNSKFWLIYDVKRNYGIYYNTFGIETISINTNQILEYKTNNNIGKTKKIPELNNCFQLNDINTLVLNKLHNEISFNTLSDINVKNIAI